MMTDWQRAWLFGYALMHANCEKKPPARAAAMRHVFRAGGARGYISAEMVWLRRSTHWLRRHPVDGPNEKPTLPGEPRLLGRVSAGRGTAFASAPSSLLAPSIAVGWRVARPV